MSTTLAQLNAAAANHTVGMIDARRMLGNMARSIGDDQIMREILHNAFHGQAGNSNPTIRVTAVDRFGVAKLAVIDAGCGMSGEELLEYIGNMSSSGTTTGDRFGLGIKLAGLYTSPAGVEYVSWDGVNEPVSGILADFKGEQTFLPMNVDGDKFVAVAVSELPEIIRNAGHGTMVVLHGRTPLEDTYHTMLDAVAAGKTKGFSLYFNSRYADIPEGSSIELHALRKKSGDPLVSGDHRTVGSVGLTKVLEAVAEQQGTYVGDGWQIRWYHIVNPGKDRNFDHNDTCVNHNLVAVTFGDSEIPGLREVYELASGTSGTSRLATFGLGPITKQMAVVVDILDPAKLGVAPNMARTMLEQGGKQLLTTQFANEFKDNMPSELVDIIDAAIDVRNVDVSGELERFMLAHLDLFDLSKLTPSGVTLTAGGAGGSNASTKSTRTKRGGGGGGGGGGKVPNGTKPGGKSTPQAGGNVQLPLVPSVIDWDDVDDEYKYCFAFWDPTRYCLMVNNDWYRIDAETDSHLAERKNVTAQQRKMARQVVRDHMVFAALEAVVAIMAVKTVDPHASNWDFALEPQGLSTAVLPMSGRTMDVRKRISKILGKNP